MDAQAIAGAHATERRPSKARRAPEHRVAQKARVTATTVSSQAHTARQMEVGHGSPVIKGIDVRGLGLDQVGAKGNFWQLIGGPNETFTTAMSSWRCLRQGGAHRCSCIGLTTMIVMMQKSDRSRRGHLTIDSKSTGGKDEKRTFSGTKVRAFALTAIGIATLVFAPARAETPEEWIALGARVHGAFGSLIPVGIRIGLDALQRLNAKPREVTVVYYDSDKAPWASAL